MLWPFLFYQSENMKAKRTTSHAMKVEAIAGAMNLPEPPKHMKLHDSAVPFWESIVRTRPPASWTKTDLELAATLARYKADLVDVEQQLNDQDHIVDGKVNPLNMLRDKLTRQILSLTQQIQVGASATVGKAALQQNKAELHRKSQEIVHKTETAELIAKPH